MQPPLLKLLLLAPLALSHPTLLPRAESACALAVRTGFTWTAANYTGPTGVGMPVVQFTLTNSAVNYTHYCQGSAHMITPFDGTNWFRCDGAKGAMGGSAEFSYDYDTGTLAVRQGWECDNGEKGRPQYIAEGTGVAVEGATEVVIGLETIRGIL